MADIVRLEENGVAKYIETHTKAVVGLNEELTGLQIVDTLWSGEAKVGDTINVKNMASYDILRFFINFRSGGAVVEKPNKNSGDFWVTGMGLKGNRKGLYVDEVTLNIVSETQFKFGSFIRLDTETGTSVSDDTSKALVRVEGIKKK